MLTSTLMLFYDVYPFFVATFFGWIWTLSKSAAPLNSMED
jgi:hypothetical protein